MVKVATTPLWKFSNGSDLSESQKRKLLYDNTVALLRRAVNHQAKPLRSFEFYLWITVPR